MGAVTIAASSVIKGTFLSHDGACGAREGSFIQGRMLSTSGAVTTNTTIICTVLPCVTSSSSVILPIEQLSLLPRQKTSLFRLTRLLLPKGIIIILMLCALLMDLISLQL
jgi:hypothetical protein